MRVMLLDGDWPQTPYLVAELNALDLDVLLVSPVLDDPKGLRRYCRQIQTPLLTDPRYHEFLEEVLRTEPADIIVPLCEPIQQWLWERDEALSNVFPATTPRQREILADRRQLYELATSVGVPIPTTEAIAGEDDLPRVVSALGLPLVLRGTQGLAGEQVRIARTLDDARTAYRMLQSVSPGPPFAQEFLEGPRSLIGALVRQGTIIQSFSQCTLEACPPPTGPSVRVKSLVDPVLTSYADRLFGALGWDGAACAEFIRLGPGDFRFLEINPRPWAAIRAAHDCGVPMVTLFARYLAGQSVQGGLPFPDGKECTLFPLFIAARIRWGQFPRLSDARAYAQMLRSVPWNRPALVRHYLRFLWWSMHAERLDQVPPAGRPVS